MSGSLATSIHAGVPFSITTDDDLRESVDRYFSQDFPVSAVIQKFSHAAADSIPFHWHEELQMTWVQEGVLEYSVNGETFLLGTDRLLFVRDHCLHASKTVGGDVRTLCVNFTPGIFHPMVLKNYIRPLLEDRRYSYTLLPIGAERLSALERIGDPSKASIDCFAALNLLSGCFEEILRRPEETVAGAEDEELQLFQTMIDFLHGNYAAEITVRAIAASAGVGKNRCTELFQKYAGQPPAKYLAQYRLHLAKSLLLHSSQSVSEISANTGYNQVSHFIEQFRLRYGLSPLRYRREYKRE